MVVVKLLAVIDFIACKWFDFPISKRMFQKIVNYIGFIIDIVRQNNDAHLTFDVLDVLFRKFYSPMLNDSLKLNT